MYWEYFKYVMRHKINYIKAVRRRTSGTRGEYRELLKALFHDLSKFSFSEFKPYAKWFYGRYGKGYNDFSNNFIQEKHEHLFKNFEEAVEHHYAHNKHHWNYWIGRDMPYDYIKEMVYDWSAMGMQFGNTSQEYYLKNYYTFDMTYMTRLKTEEELGLNYSDLCGYGHTLEDFALTYSEEEYMSDGELEELQHKYWDIRQFFLNNSEQGSYKIIGAPKNYEGYDYWTPYEIGDIIYGRKPRGSNMIKFETKDGRIWSLHESYLEKVW